MFTLHPASWNPCTPQGHLNTFGAGCSPARFPPGRCCVISASLRELGCAFRRDHTSVLCAVRKFRANLAQDPSAVVALQFLRPRLEEWQLGEERPLLQLPVLQRGSGR